MNLRSIDLNLLVVLQALLAERHVSKAAKRVGLSQPALSNALERLRVLFDDPILIRHGNRFMPSPKAERLAGPLNDVLAGVEAVVGLFFSRLQHDVTVRRRRRHQVGCDLRGAGAREHFPHLRNLDQPLLDHRLHFQ